ncbi:MAG: HEPN domain-containing protein [Candidatus Latescibacterota bacterium]
MSGRDLGFAGPWMRKAANDLYTARCVLADPAGPTDTPCFHAQQAVEKALKAVLTASGERFGRTHNLMPLLEQAARRLPDLGQHRAACAQLTAYAVAARYPEHIDDPSRQDAEEALEWATAICTEVVRFLAEAASAGTEPAEQTDPEE